MTCTDADPHPRSRALDLTGRSVLITGGAGALGHAIRETLSGHGARMHSFDLEDDIDAADPVAVEAALDELEEKDGACPDVALCHAGIVGTHPLVDYPLADFDLALRSNLRAAFVTARAVSRRWIATSTPGHLVFTSSWVASIPWPDIGAYTATKAGIVQLMRQFALELAPYGIRANAVAPGIVAAGMAQRQWDTDLDYRRRAARAVPLGVLQTPQSVADAFLFMVSPLAGYMTGAVLTVDGGASLRPME